MTLFLTLPAQPNAVRLRVWRALKTLGCATLRNGIYLLPESHSTQFDPIVEEVRSHGGQAYVLSLSSREESMRTEILSHFDRSESYERWQLDTLTLESSLSKLKETDARRRLRVISESLQALHRIDYYAGTAAEQARIKLEAPSTGRQCAVLPRRTQVHCQTRHSPFGSAQVSGQALDKPLSTVGR